MTAGFTKNIFINGSSQYLQMDKNVAEVNDIYYIFFELEHFIYFSLLLSYVKLP